MPFGISLLAAPFYLILFQDSQTCAWHPREFQKKCNSDRRSAAGLVLCICVSVTLIKASVSSGNINFHQRSINFPVNAAIPFAWFPWNERYLKSGVSPVKQRISETLGIQTALCWPASALAFLEEYLWVVCPSAIRSRLIPARSVVTSRFKAQNNQAATTTRGSDLWTRSQRELRVLAGKARRTASGLCGRGGWSTATWSSIASSEPCRTFKSQGRYSPWDLVEVGTRLSLRGRRQFGGNKGGQTGREGEWVCVVLGQVCAVPWIPGCWWMQERVAARRSPPPWAARPRRPLGHRSEGSSWRRGNGVGLPEEQRGSPSSGSPSRRALGRSAPGPRDSHPHQGADAPSSGLAPAPALPTSPALPWAGGKRAPPRRARGHLAGHRTVVTATRQWTSGSGSLARRRKGRREAALGRGCADNAGSSEGRRGPAATRGSAGRLGAQRTGSGVIV